MILYQDIEMRALICRANDFIEIDTFIPSDHTVIQVEAYHFLPLSTYLSSPSVI